MPREINFARLRLQDALDLAILVEEEAEERYQEFAEQMELYYGPEAAQFFLFMSGNEAKHGQELRIRRRALFGEAPATIDRGMLFEVEAPSPDRVRAFMSARQALEVALESEVKAHDFFVQALPHIADPEVKRLFDELRLEEVQHQEMVKEQLVKQPPDDGLDPEDFVDEPPAL